MIRISKFADSQNFLNDDEIKVALSNPRLPEKEIHLFYKLFDKPIARKYAAVLRRTLKSGVAIIDPDRFHNFPGCHKDKRWVMENINRCIATINDYAPGTIPEEAKLEMPQSFLNHLHVYFEKLRGSVLSPGPFYSAAPLHVQQALTDYNLLIHRFEDLRRGELLNKACPHAICCWDPERRERLPLAPEDFKEFRTGGGFGFLNLNYCELGKPILDVYYDQDEVIGDDNIRPLRYYSADIFFDFTPVGPTRFYRRWMKNYRLRKWWRKNHHRVAGTSTQLFSPANALGHITLGMLDRLRGSVKGLSDQEIIELVGQHQFFKGIQVVND